jgi:hypothetical protein
MRAAVIEDQGLVRDYLAGVLSTRLGVARDRICWFWIWACLRQRRDCGY